MLQQTGLLSTIFFFSTKLVTVFPPTGVTLFFTYPFRGMTKPHVKYYMDLQRQTASEYTHFTEIIMHKYIHAYSPTCCMHPIVE